MTLPPSAARRSLCVGALVAIAWDMPAAAQQGSYDLTGAWCGARTDLAVRGVSPRSGITSYYQGGTIERTEADGSGHVDVLTNLNFGKMGVIAGLGFRFHGEMRLDDPRAQFGGELWPSNAGAILPLAPPGRFVATSLAMRANLNSDQHGSRPAGQADVTTTGETTCR